MQVNINGDRRTINVTTLADAVAELGYGDSAIATALNGEFVPAPMRDITQLSDGDRIELLAPMQGG